MVAPACLVPREHLRGLALDVPVICGVRIGIPECSRGIRMVNGTLGA